MLFFGVFLRETARPVAKSRTNFAHIQEKLPNRWTDWHQIWHTCADSSENGYMPNQLNLKTQGGISGDLGCHKSKSLGRLSNDWTDWHQILYTSADSSGNGYRLNTIRPSTWGGGLGGHTFKSQGKMSNGWPIGIKFGTHVQIHLGMDIRQTNCPERHMGHLGGFSGSNIQKSGEAVKRLDQLAPTLVHVCGFI